MFITDTIKKNQIKSKQNPATCGSNPRCFPVSKYFKTEIMIGSNWQHREKRANLAHILMLKHERRTGVQTKKKKKKMAKFLSWEVIFID